jgi:hypothetical protein
VESEGARGSHDSPLSGSHAQVISKQHVGRGRLGALGAKTRKHQVFVQRIDRGFPDAKRADVPQAEDAWEPEPSRLSISELQNGGTRKPGAPV